MGRGLLLFCINIDLPHSCTSHNSLRCVMQSSPSVALFLLTHVAGTKEAGSSITCSYVQNGVWGRVGWSNAFSTILYNPSILMVRTLWITVCFLRAPSTYISRWIADEVHLSTHLLQTGHRVQLYCMYQPLMSRQSGDRQSANLSV